MQLTVGKQTVGFFTDVVKLNVQRKNSLTLEQNKKKVRDEETFILIVISI